MYIPRRLRSLTRTMRGEPTLPLVRPAERPRDFDRYLFICGLHRSGTSLLESLLGAFCDFAVLRADVPENEGQHLQDVYPSAAVRGGAGRFAFSPEMHPAPPEGDALAAARDRLLACWTPFVVGEGRMLLEKSPPNLTKIAWLRAVFPGASFLILTRDPRAVAVATDKWTTTSLKEIVFHWHVAHDAAWRDMGPDCCHIRYEDLCRDPEGEISRVVSALALPKRTAHLDLPARFGTVTSSNAGYIREFAPMKFGQGAWDHFGYDGVTLETTTGTVAE